MLLETMNILEYINVCSLSIHKCYMFLLQESYERAKSLLKSHHKEHQRLAAALLKYETLSAEEIDLVIKGKKLQKKI